MKTKKRSSTKKTSKKKSTKKKGFSLWRNNRGFISLFSKKKSNKKVKTGSKNPKFRLLGIVFLLIFGTVGVYMLTSSSASTSHRLAQSCKNTDKECRWASKQGEINRIYEAVFNRTADKGGLDFWTGRYKGSTTIEQVGQQIFNAGGKQGKFAKNSSKAKFVDRLYSHVLGRKADSGGRNYWVKRLGKGTPADRVRLIIVFTNEAGPRNKLFNSTTRFLTRNYPYKQPKAPKKAKTSNQSSSSSSSSSSSTASTPRKGGNPCAGVTYASSRSSIVACQKLIGTAADGIWGPNTERAYNSYFGHGSGCPASRCAQNPEVRRQVQSSTPSRSSVSNNQSTSQIRREVNTQRQRSVSSTSSKSGNLTVARTARAVPRPRSNNTDSRKLAMTKGNDLPPAANLRSARLELTPYVCLTQPWEEPLKCSYYN